MDAPVFVVEGEKDADSLAILGLLATTNSGGAGKWRSEFCQFFLKNGESHPIAILPNNDEASRKHGKDVAASLVYRNARVKIVELPGLPPKGDVSDWLGASHTGGELLALVEAAPAAGARAAPAETPSQEAPPSPLRERGLLLLDNRCDGATTQDKAGFNENDVDFSPPMSSPPGPASASPPPCAPAWPAACKSTPGNCTVLASTSMTCWPRRKPGPRPPLRKLRPR